jgi:hypothetical protein
VRADRPADADGALTVRSSESPASAGLFLRSPRQLLQIRYCRADLVDLRLVLAYCAVKTFSNGLYGCAVQNVLSDDVNGSISWATGRCMNARQLRDPPFYKDRADDFAKRGWIDPLDNLKSSKVYLFTGG